MGQELQSRFKQILLSSVVMLLILKSTMCMISQVSVRGKPARFCSQVFPLPKEHLKIPQLGHPHAGKQDLVMLSLTLRCKLELLQSLSSHS